MERLYNHLHDCVQKQLPSQVIERIRKLFIEGMGYPDPEVELELYKIIFSGNSQEEFKYLLNRCCHILINNWHRHPLQKSACADLVNLFQYQMESASLSPAVLRLRQLVNGFTQSEEYNNLRKLVEFIDSKTEGYSRKATTIKFENLIENYPYLYPSYLDHSTESSQEKQQIILEMQVDRQRKFEVNLAHYLIRKSYGSERDCGTEAEQKNKDTHNPTFLSDRELCLAFKQYTGPVHNLPSYREQNREFLSLTTGKTYGEFKEHLQEYLLIEFTEQHGHSFFENRLSKFFTGLYPDNNSHHLSETLLLKTCKKLIDLLIPSPQDKEALYFYVLIDNNNLQLTGAVGLLLKIVLLCSRVIENLKNIREYLFLRISYWFNHFKGVEISSQEWLVKFLDNVQIAFTSYFGSIDRTILEKFYKAQSLRLTDETILT